MLSDGQTMLHLLVSTNFHDEYVYEDVCTSDVHQSRFDKDMREWHDQAIPLLQLLLSIEGAIIKRHDNNNTAMGVCHKQYKKFMSAMQNARLSAATQAHRLCFPEATSNLIKARQIY